MVYSLAGGKQGPSQQITGYKQGRQSKTMRQSRKQRIAWLIDRLQRYGAELSFLQEAEARRQDREEFKAEVAKAAETLQTIRDQKREARKMKRLADLGINPAEFPELPPGYFPNIADSGKNM
jgi:hypothetical protein